MGFHGFNGIEWTKIGNIMGEYGIQPTTNGDFNGIEWTLMGDNGTNGTLWYSWIVIVGLNSILTVLKMTYDRHDSDNTLP